MKQYIADLFGIDSKAIRPGLIELEAPEDQSSATRHRVLDSRGRAA